MSIKTIVSSFSFTEKKTRTNLSMFYLTKLQTNISIKEEKEGNDKLLHTADLHISSFDRA